MARLLLFLLVALCAPAAIITADPGGSTTTVTASSSSCGVAVPIGSFAVSFTGVYCGPYIDTWGFVNSGRWNRNENGFGVIVLESYNLEASAPVSTPGGTNEGAFRGITVPNVDPPSASVPEPATLVLTAAALAAIYLRRG